MLVRTSTTWSNWSAMHSSRIELFEAVYDTLKRAVLKTDIGRRTVLYYLHLLTDCYVVSYPKSGRTWLRVMLAKLLAQHYNYAHEFVVDPLKVIRCSNSHGPRIQFTHHGPDQTPTERRNYSRFHGRKVVFLVRDPRDVLVSYYFQRTRREGENYELPEFIRHPWWGIDRVISYMNEWYDHREEPDDFLLIRYEEMHRKTFETLQTVATFVGLEQVDPVHLQNAVAYASFQNMLRLSTGALRHVSKLAPADSADPESHKFRRGRVAGYVDYLSQKDIEFLDARIREDLYSEFGYAGTSTF